MATPLTPRDTARYLLECAEEHMANVHGPHVAMTLAARAQAEAMLAVAEAIEAVLDSVNAMLVPKPK